MRNPKLDYFAVGAFVLAMLAALAVVVAVLTGRTGPTDSYSVRYGDATGLKFGTRVLYMGFPVGQVEDIQPRAGDDNRVEFEVTLSVAAGWRIPADSVAEVRASGLLAAVAIDIRAGASERSLAPGGELVGRGRRDLLGAVSDTANTIKHLTEQTIVPFVHSLDGYTQTLGRTIERDAAPMIADLRSSAAVLAARLPLAMDAFLALAADVRATSDRLRALLDEENVARLDSVVVNLERGSAQLVALAADTRVQLEALFGDATRERVRRVLDNVAEASGDVAGLSRDARSRLNEVLGAENRAKLAVAIDNIGRAAGNVAALSEELRGTGAQVRRLLAALEGTAVRGAPLLEDSVADLRHALAVVAEHVDAIVHNLDGSSRNMYEFSRELRMNPGLLLGGRPPADLAAEPARRRE